MKLYKKMAMISFAILLSAIGLPSCGTITGLNSKVLITSAPEGAEININGNVIGKTPQIIKFKNSKEYNIVLKYQGYNDGQRFIPEADISAGAIVCDILFAGVIGIVVDAITGGFHKDKDIDGHTLFYDFTNASFILTPAK